MRLQRDGPLHSRYVAAHSDGPSALELLLTLRDSTRILSGGKDWTKYKRHGSWRQGTKGDRFNDLLGSSSRIHMRWIRGKGLCYPPFAPCMLKRWVISTDMFTELEPRGNADMLSQSSVTLEEIENVDRFVQAIEKIELPNQLVACLADPLLQKLMQLRPDESNYRRVSAWIVAFGQDVLNGEVGESHLLEMLAIMKEYVSRMKVSAQRSLPSQSDFRLPSAATSSCFPRFPEGADEDSASRTRTRSSP